MSITAVLLAGGESRRMGRDKATLVWRGRPLWEWQIEKLRALCPKKILLSARSDFPWRPADVGVVLDTPPSRGPLSALAAVSASIETDHLLALAVDMPFITTEHLRLLCGLVKEGVGTVPTIDGNAEPLAAIYPKDAQSIFLAAMEEGNFSLQPIVAKLVRLEMLRVMPVTNSAREYYKNINQVQDFD